MKKIVSLVLALCTVMSLAVCFSVAPAAEGATTSWDNTTLDYYDQENTPFRYMYFVRANQNFSSVPEGFGTSFGLYPTVYMSTSPHGNAGNYFYPAGTTSAHDASISYALFGAKSSRAYFAVQSAHCFVAPYTGTITFNYSFGRGGDAASDDIQLYYGVSKGGNTAINCIDINVMSGNQTAPAGTTADIGACSKFDVEFEVEAGDLVWFVPANNSGNWHQIRFYINTAEYTEIVDSTAATVIGHNIAALDQPVVRFYVKYDEAPALASASLTVGSDSATVVEGELYTGAGPDGTTLTAADNVYVYSIPVSAKRMTETITISIKDGDGNEMLTTNNTYSVNTYCQAMIADYKAAGTSATDAQISLAKTCTSILLYGRYAQNYFNYNTENLPEIDSAAFALISEDLGA